MEEYEEMYLLGGRYGGGRGDVPDADIEEDHVLADMEEDEEMYLEADIEEDHVLADMEENEEMSWQIWRRTRRCTCLEADMEEDEEMYLLGGRY